MQHTVWKRTLAYLKSGQVGRLTAGQSATSKLPLTQRKYQLYHNYLRISLCINNILPIQ